jgi:hypothetical protein
MTRYKWEDVIGEGDYLWEALENEFKNARDCEYTNIGKYAKRMWEDDEEYFTSEDTDWEYAQYCKEHDADVPKDKGEAPRCKGCGTKLDSRYEWAVESANNNSMYSGSVKEIGYQFDDLKDNEIIAEAFKLNPQPIEAYDEEENDWISIEEYVLRCGI